MHPSLAVTVYHVDRKCSQSEDSISRIGTIPLLEQERLLRLRHTAFVGIIRSLTHHLLGNCRVHSCIDFEMGAVGVLDRAVGVHRVARASDVKRTWNRPCIVSMRLKCLISIKSLPFGLEHPLSHTCRIARESYPWRVGVLYPKLDRRVSSDLALSNTIKKGRSRPDS